MDLVGKAVAFGAVTVVNAISCGFGAALGIDLKTEASVRLTDKPRRIEGRILSDPAESAILIEKVVSLILRHLKVEDAYGAYVETKSNIPIARGLKSSSVAANAIALAVCSALGKNVDDLTIVNLGVNAAIEAKVTITGAFDDACASYFGGLVITDNYERKILRHIPIEDHAVLIHVPPRKAYTSTSNVERMRLIAEEVKAVHKLALSGEYWPAMTINGILYSTVLGYDPSITLDAISAGALASGLSGKGPAVAAVVSRDRVEKIRDVWKRYDGEIIEANVNHVRAHVLK